jgi:hypothetical protein
MAPPPWIPTMPSRLGLTAPSLIGVHYQQMLAGGKTSLMHFSFSHGDKAKSKRKS